MKKRQLFTRTLALCLALLLAVQPMTLIGAAAETAGGSCGDNLTWTLDESGVLTVSGSGRMQHMYGAENFPWHPYRNQIREVVLDEGVTSVSQYAFADCAELERVTTPTTLTEISGQAFMDCASLTDVTLASGLTDISLKAFSGTGITQIAIPDTVTYIGGGAFQNTPLKEIVIPDSVTAVGGEAFSGCTELTAVTLSEGMQSLQQGLFADCTALESITFPLAVRLIVDKAFHGCTALHTLTFEGDSVNIDSNAFEGVSATAYYPANNDTWTADLFLDYGGTLTWTGYFRQGNEIDRGQCGDAAAWVFYDDGLLEITGTGAMEDFKNGNTPWKAYRDQIEEVRVGEGVTHIGDWSFYECKKAAAFSLPEGLLSIGENAFVNCGAMETLSLPGSLTQLQNNVFRNCTSLTTLVIPEGVTSIGSHLFYGCTGLTTLTIPEGITALQGHTFQGCRNLETIYLPASLTQIGEVEFEDCYSLRGIWAADGSTAFSNDENGVLFNLDKTILLACPGGYEGDYAVPETVTAIGEHAFTDCLTLTGVTLPDSVQTIGSSAFWECIALEHINIPDGMKEISPFMLALCESLPAVTLPESVEVIGDAAFMGCEVLNGLVLPDSVHTIGATAFGECYSLTEIVIPDGVSSIEMQLFRNCHSLVSVTLPDTIQEIGDTAFLRCYSLKHVTIPDGVQAIAYGTFMRCYGLESVDIPESVTWIGLYAFYQCENLIRADIPDGVTELRDYTFYDCLDLEEVILPDGMTSIGRYAFYGCDHLDAIDLPDALTSIGEYAFSYTAMTEVTIPAGVTRIGDYAFINDYMTRIRFLGGAPVFSDHSLGGITADAYYPLGDASWTPDVMLDYGGDITWVGYTADQVYRAAFTQVSISLEGDIGLNFYADLSEDLAAAEDAYLQFSVAGETRTIPVSQAELCDDGTYRFTCAVPAKGMTDQVTAQMYTSLGAVGAPRSYSVKQYCDAMIDYVQTNGLTDHDALLDLMKALLNYGAYSQISLGYRTGDLANADLSGSDRTLPETIDASAYAHSISGSEEGIRICSASLLLESTTTIRFYFQLTGDKGIEAYTFLADGRPVTPVRSGDLYRVDVANITAKDLDGMHTVSVGGLTVTYGGLSYVNQILSWSGASEDVTNTAKALYAYAMAANAYFEES